MEMNKKSLIYLAILEFIIILALIGLLFMSLNMKKQTKCTEEPEVKEKAPEDKGEPPKEPAPEPEKPTDTPASEELPVVTAFREYYKNQNLADMSNISTWEFTTAKEVTDKNYPGYYEFSGYYSCKDNSSDCVYLEQVGDPINGNNVYGFVLYVKVEQQNGTYSFSDIRTNLD